MPAHPDARRAAPPQPSRSFHRGAIRSAKAREAIATCTTIDAAHRHEGIRLQAWSRS
jgi:hypothetical protein